MGKDTKIVGKRDRDLKYSKGGSWEEISRDLGRNLNDICYIKLFVYIIAIICFFPFEK